MKNTAVGEGLWYGCGSPLVHAQFLSMTHDLPFPALIRSESESPKMTEGEKKSLLIHTFGHWLSRGSGMGGGGVGTKTRLDSRSWSLTSSVLRDFCRESQFPVRFTPSNLKPAVPVQAWGRVLPQRGSAVDGSLCADRSNWRVQAKMKLERDEIATAGGLTTHHFWAFPASHHCCCTS